MEGRAYKVAIYKPARNIYVKAGVAIIAQSKSNIAPLQVTAGRRAKYIYTMGSPAAVIKGY
jgi:hypothetical protein